MPLIRNENVMGYPSPEQLHYGYGIAYLDSRRFVDSINELKQVVTLNPKNADGLLRACNSVPWKRKSKGSREATKRFLVT